MHGGAVAAMASLSLVLSPIDLHAATVAATEPAEARLALEAEGTTSTTWPSPAMEVTAANGRTGLPGDGGPSTVTVSTPKGSRTVSDGTLLPARAVAAYQRAATVLAEVDPTCGVSWTLLAAIGRVESDHGRYGDASLGADGVSRPLIIGVPLNGKGPVARIADTDGGTHDRDRVWDRAVGPMQFLPTTWAVVGVDGDGDGVRSPNDIDDAALAAAVYLCAGSVDVESPANIRAALRRYNNSDSYVSLVMAFERSYRTGDFSISPALPSATAVATPHFAVGRPVRREVTKATDAMAGSDAMTLAGGRTKRVSSPGSDRPSSKTTPNQAPATSKPPSSTSPNPPTAPSSPQSPASPGPKPDATPGPQPSNTPDPSPNPSPDPSPEPKLVEAAGVWEACGEGYCLNGKPLDLGVDRELPAAGDFDLDGLPEDVGTEFAGLVGTPVTLLVVEQPDVMTVYGINGLAYLLADGTPAQPDV